MQTVIVNRDKIENGASNSSKTRDTQHMCEYLRSTMGMCLSGCVNFATYCHDKYNDWRWEEGDLTELDMIPRPSSSSQLRTKSIHTAVIDKNINEVKRILEEDDTSKVAVNSSQETALHSACKLGYLPVIDVLLESECDPRIITELGSPIHCLLQASYCRGMRSPYLTKEEAVSYIHKMALHGCPIESVDKGGKTALFCAVENGAKECIECLLQLGASVNCQDNNLFTPLYMAVILGDIWCTQLLLRRVPRLEVDAADSAGRTPLMAALITIMNNLKYERMPLNTNHVIPTGYDLPEDDLEANRWNRMMIVEALLHAGADPNKMDNHGRTALTITFLILELDNINVIFNNPTGAQIRWENAPPTHRSSFIRADSEESVFAMLVRLMVMVGAVPPSGWDKNYSKAPAWLQKLYDLVISEEVSDQKFMEKDKPLSLQSVVRSSIRMHLASLGKVHHIHTLPLPSTMIDFLSIKSLPFTF